MLAQRSNHEPDRQDRQHREDHQEVDADVRFRALEHHKELPSGVAGPGHRWHHKHPWVLAPAKFGGAQSPGRNQKQASDNQDVEWLVNKEIAEKFHNDVR